MLFHCKPVNQQKNIDICINFMGRTKTKPFLKRKQVPKLYFHFWPPKKCPPFFFLIHTWWCENITASPWGCICSSHSGPKPFRPQSSPVPVDPDSVYYYYYYCLCLFFFKYIKYFRFCNIGVWREVTLRKEIKS